MLRGRVLAVVRMPSPCGGGYAGIVLIRSPHRNFSSEPSSNPPSTPPKLPLGKRVWTRVKEEAHHYWTGTRLLGSNVRVSTSLLYRVAKGEILSRREKKLLETTVGDLIRMVPFIVIAVVPFLEFSLPLLLRFFPNLLPSTYATADLKKKNMDAKLQIRLEMAKFLKSATTSYIKAEKAKEVTEETAVKFFERASQGKPVSNAEIMKVGKLLKNEFAISRIATDELKAVAKLFGVSVYGPRSYVEYNLERKLRYLRDDDAMIATEGIEKLNMEELTQANVMRGMKVEGRTREQMEQQLEDWMELADSEEVPPFLLLLSRSFSTTAEQSPEVVVEAIDRLVKSGGIETIIKSLPDDAALNEKVLSLRKAETVDDSGRSDISASFHAWDLDKDGTISKEELKQALHRLEENFTEEEVEEKLKQVDSNADGRIDFQEFLQVMRENEHKEVLVGLRDEILKTKREMKRLEDVELSDEAALKVNAKIDSMIEKIEKELKRKESIERLKSQAQKDGKAQTDGKVEAKDNNEKKEDKTKDNMTEALKNSATNPLESTKEERREKKD